MKSIVNALLIVFLLHCFIGYVSHTNGSCLSYHGNTNVSSCLTMGFSKQQLIALRNEFTSNSTQYISVLKENAIFKYKGPRGSRAGKYVKKRIFTIPTISDKNECTSSAASNAACSNISQGADHYLTRAVSSPTSGLVKEVLGCLGVVRSCPA